MIKTTIIVILYYLKRNTDNEAKLHVIYICWSKTVRLQFLLTSVRLQFLFTSFSELLHEKKMCKSNSVKTIYNFLSGKKITLVFDE